MPDHHRTTAGRAMRAAALAAFVLATASCDGYGSGGTTGPVPADEVSVRNNTFSPGNRTVAAGTTVTFRWANGAAMHNVTFDDGPASANQSTGTYTRTFNNAGSFPYHCTIHGAGMSGTVTVQ